MNDATPPADHPPAPAVEPTEGDPKDLVGRMRERGVRTASSAGKVPSLEHEQTYGCGKKHRRLRRRHGARAARGDGRLRDKELYGDSRHAAASAEEGPKKGKVFRIHGPDVFIDLPGGRTQGVLPLAAIPRRAAGARHRGRGPHRGLRQRQRRAAAVAQGGGGPGRLVQRRRRQTVEARVTGTNKGGLAVDVNGIRGFMPISQIDLYRVEDAEQYVNQRLLCLVTEVDPAERNLVVSRRALLEKEREENREKLWAELAEGQVREGDRALGQGLRRLRGPRRRGRPDPRQRDELDARAGRGQGRAAGPDGQGRGAQDRPRDGARSAWA